MRLISYFLWCEFKLSPIIMPFCKGIMGFLALELKNGCWPRNGPS